MKRLSRQLATVWAVAVLLAGCTAGSNTQPDASSATVESSMTSPIKNVPPSSSVESLADSSINLLTGGDLSNPTGIKVVVEDHIIDMDDGAQLAIDGLPEVDGPIWWTIVAAGHTVISVDCATCAAPEAFVLDSRSNTVTSIGRGFAAPAPDGVWLTEYLTATTCTLTKVGFDGAVLRPAAAWDCDLRLTEESSLGLVAWHNDIVTKGAIIDPDDLTTVREVDQVIAVVDGQLVTWNGKHFNFIDPRTEKTGAALDAPTSIGDPSAGKVSPDGNHVAIAFKHPAWPGPRQRLDIWLLDVHTRQWTRMPSMPVAASLKATSDQWLPDGRFAMFGDFDNSGNLLATWRPGDSAFSIRAVNTPTSASAVILCTPPECKPHP